MCEFILFSTVLLIKLLNLINMVLFQLGVALISFVSAWQTVLNRTGTPLFEFNTYIISVLVIFFLQKKYKLPTADKIESLTSNSSLSITNFETLKRQFFDFYGNEYQMQNHIISAYINRWQTRRIDSTQKKFSQAQQMYVSEKKSFIRL